MKVFNLKDIVNFRTPMNPTSNWGEIVEILEIRQSVHSENQGTTIYRIKPLKENGISYDNVEEKNIIHAYSMYYEENNNQSKEV